MEETVLQLTYKLKNAIANDERVIALNKIEDKMNNDIEVIALAKVKEDKLDDYNFALSHFPENSDEVLKAQKELYKAKKELESHPIVRDYLSKYKEVREMNEKINDSLFSFINNDLCKGK